MTVHICAPPAEAIALRRLHCTTCVRSRPFVGTRYEWYGWTITCLACGDRWADGERLARPFARGWRERSQQDARALYRRLRAAGVPFVAAPTTEPEE